MVLDSASYKIGQSVKWAWIGPGGMVGRCREVLPGGIRAASGDGFCGLADLVPEEVVGVAVYRCRPGEQGGCGVGREVHDPDGIGELAEGVGDLVKLHVAMQPHVITGQT